MPLHTLLCGIEPHSRACIMKARASLTACLSGTHMTYKLCVVSAMAASGVPFSGSIWKPKPSTLKAQKTETDTENHGTLEDCTLLDCSAATVPSGSGAFSCIHDRLLPCLPWILFCFSRSNFVASVRGCFSLFQSIVFHVRAEGPDLVIQGVSFLWAQQFFWRRICN